VEELESSDKDGGDLRNVANDMPNFEKVPKTRQTEPQAAAPRRKAMVRRFGCFLLHVKIGIAEE
jgi:hypothetical protein